LSVKYDQPWHFYYYKGFYLYCEIEVEENAPETGSLCKLEEQYSVSAGTHTLLIVNFCFVCGQPQRLSKLFP